MQPDDDNVFELDDEEGEFFEVSDHDGKAVVLSRRNTRIKRAHPHKHKPIVTVTFDDGVTVILRVSFDRLLGLLRGHERGRRRGELMPVVPMPDDEGEGRRARNRQKLRDLGLDLDVSKLGGQGLADLDPEDEDTGEEVLSPPDERAGERFTPHTPPPKGPVHG